MPTAEAVAEWILYFAVHKRGVDEGEVAMHGWYLQPIVDQGWTQADYQRGIELAMERGWIEPVSEVMFRISASGYDRA